MPRLLPGTSPETDLYALTDDELSLGRPAVEVAKALLDSGIKILQYREKEKKAGQMLKECLELRRLTREAGACFIVNDHVDIAVLCEADGVHVGQEDLPVEAVRRLVGPACPPIPLIRPARPWPPVRTISGSAPFTRRRPKRTFAPL